MDEDSMKVAETGVISRTCSVSLFQGRMLRQPAGGDGGALGIEFLTDTGVSMQTQLYTTKQSHLDEPGDMPH